jgi:hypothetical protein
MDNAIVTIENNETSIVNPADQIGEGFSASKLRAEYKAQGWTGKELTAKVNRELAMNQPAADAAFAALRQQGFTVGRFAKSKAGNYAVSLVKPKAGDAVKRLSAAQKEVQRQAEIIRELKAQLAAK